MGGFIVEKINGTLSKGELTIETRNPADNPAINFNYFSEPEDLQKCVKGIETILNVIDSEAFSKYKFANMTKQDILDLNINLPNNLNVYSNTIDDEYKVIGVNFLRVIDGSTLLNSSGTNPQASVMMLERYMGVTILNQRLALDKPYTDSSLVGTTNIKGWIRPMVKGGDWIWLPELERVVVRWFWVFILCVCYLIWVLKDVYRLCLDLMKDDGGIRFGLKGMTDFAIGRVVSDAAHRKRSKYMAKCAAIGYGFLSFSFTSLGELEADVVTLLKRIQKFSMV
nr:protein HOTHEAD-like [Tanacetum cinerariifolium]